MLCRTTICDVATKRPLTQQCFSLKDISDLAGLLLRSWSRVQSALTVLEDMPQRSQSQPWNF